MANNIVQLTDYDNNNIYPIAGAAAQGSITKTMLDEGVFVGAELSDPGNIAYVGTSDIQDNAVTAPKLGIPCPVISENLSEPSSVAYVATDNIQDGAVTSDKIDSATLMYHTNDTLTIPGGASYINWYVTCGLITSAGTEISFNIVLPKSAMGTSPIFTEGVFSARHTGGGYIFSDADITTFNVTMAPLPNNTIGVIIKKSDGTAFSNVTNNTPVSLVGHFTIKF